MIRRRKMGATPLTPTLTRHHLTKNPNNDNNNNNIQHHQHGPVVEEIEGVIRVYKDGHVERTQIVPCVGPSFAPELGVACSDIVVDKFTNVWARFYVPMSLSTSKLLPLLVYFHGGGFCVGSASWVCYHEFLARLSARLQCLIMSVNYRLAPENPLPAAYEDGVKAVFWLKQHANPKKCDHRSYNLWAKQCDFSRIFLAGDSAGGNIAHHVAARLAAAGRTLLKPLNLKGTILIQPFFGGEARTESERRVAQPPQRSVLNLAASDAYWLLALPRGANRDHPFCNPETAAAAAAERMLVCGAEIDILRDREMKFCEAAERGGKKVERVVYRGVGHAFQILGKSQVAQTRTSEMMFHIDAFINHLS